MTTIHLRTAGVSLLLEAAPVVASSADSSVLPGLPAVVHWGADLGRLSPADASALRLTGVSQVVGNEPDEPIRMSLVPEGRTGWTGRPGLAGSRGGTAWTPSWQVTCARLDGEVLALDGRHYEAGHGVVTVSAADRDAGLELCLELELTAAGLVGTRGTLTNTAGGPYQLEELSLALPVPRRAGEVLDFAGRWSKERVAQRAPLGTAVHLRENRRGRTGPGSGPVHLGEPGFGFRQGEVWSIHLAWSGNHRHWAERDHTGEGLLGGGELLLPGEVVLAESESYRSPWLYGSYGVGLDEVARRFHRQLRARPQHPQRPRPVTINVWEAVYFDHDLARLTDLADRAAAIGVERFVLDDGWFGARRDDRAGLGDWTVSEQVWPDGLGPLVDHVTALGMEFGLWFEPEMVNPDSELARAHPEWILAPGERWPVESRHQQVLNLADPDCWQHIHDRMVALLDEYQISYLKWDHNRDLVEAADRRTGRPVVHEQTLAAYRLMAALKEHQPGLEIESCSSGGLRIDLGVLEYTDRVWVSDCIDPYERRAMHRWTSQLLPWELMGSHIASGKSHTTGRVHTLAFRASTALFGHLGLEWDLAHASEPELAELTAWIDYHKAHRTLLHTGDIVRGDLAGGATATDAPEGSLEVTGVVAPDGQRALYQIAALGRSEFTTPGRITLPGLQPDRHYAVRPRLVAPLPGLIAPAWWPAVEAPAPVFSGAVLTTLGLQGPVLPPEQAVLIEVTAVAD